MMPYTKSFAVSGEPSDHLRLGFNFTVYVTPSPAIPPFPVVGTSKAASGVSKLVFGSWSKSVMKS